MDTDHKHIECVENAQQDNLKPFADIAPYDDSEFADKMALIVQDPGFKHAINYVMPGCDYDAFAGQLKEIKSRHQFQTGVMRQFVEFLVSTTTKGLSASGIENIAPGVSYTYISNHRDIVLDASWLNLCLMRNDKPLAQVAIGNNLLIHQWITDLVKLNGSFIVKRDVKRLEALKAAQKLSGYIHYTVDKCHQSVWVAQRQGRAKDSNDLTQESLVKMLTIGGDGDAKQNLMEIHVLPVSISYEYDPNDYLKVREYLLKRRDPDFKKSERDDLLSMETGILGQKGRVHFHIGKCINNALADCQSTDRQGVAHCACQIIDKEIHANYKFFAVNYIAYDELENSTRFADKYTQQEKADFDDYIVKQLQRIDVKDITPEEYRFMRETMLSMYANPLRNHLQAVTAQ